MAEGLVEGEFISQRGGAIIGYISAIISAISSSLKVV